jgi:GNAT superfamily N-acetyltransferase
VAGHVHVIRCGIQWEIKSIAVARPQQHRGIGTALIRSVLQRAGLEGCIRVVAGTATADIENLRFYQQLGFRMDRIERDAFNCDRGYMPLEVNGIPVRDRVWFSFDLSSG